MKQRYPAMLRHKLSNVSLSLRKKYYKFLGMQINESVVLGKIKCKWPGKISVGKESVIEDDVVFKTPQPFAETNFVKIGQRVFIGHGCDFNITLGLTIGDDCLIAANTTFVDAGREMDRSLPINQQPVIHKPIILKNDVWIGTHSIILQGVTIGEGSIIGAGSLVNKSIPDYQIWAGTPARFIKNR
ncbi:DapH/DapD/GlmU-related protein [Mucilaginibacter angelicae]|uniref:DapH/DapD/GlmU-related protein n=1 Tax=Mucilaginibacter angelicae TaxID=869718 RepID=A0ABV6L3T2_9SPHI